VSGDGLRLYTDLAAWWPLLSPPSDYAEEAAFYLRTLRAACARPPRRVLELGSGGGSNASHLKAHWQLTLVDLAPGMLAVSQALNPECEHVQGDMRDVRLGRTFDAVFIHDAICYMTDERALAAAIETAFVHCAPGGAALFAPDWVRERFNPYADHGGSDGGGRGLRYLEWVWDPDPNDTTYLVDFAYLLRERDGSVRVEHDRHLEGIFPRATWLRLIAEAGFEPHTREWQISDVEPGAEVFVGVKPD
jgi:SAM-dependent methyltransferase